MIQHRGWLRGAWKIIMAGAGIVLFLATGVAYAQEEATRLYPASPMRLERVVNEVLKEKTLTLHVKRFRPVFFLMTSPCDGGNGIAASRFSSRAGVSNFFCFVTWIDLFNLKISYQLTPKGERATSLTFQFEPDTKSEALKRDLELLREDILDELHGQVSYRLPYFKE